MAWRQINVFCYVVCAIYKIEFCTPLDGLDPGNYAARWEDDCHILRFSFPGFSIKELQVTGIWLVNPSLTHTHTHTHYAHRSSRTLTKLYVWLSECILNFIFAVGPICRTMQNFQWCPKRDRTLRRKGILFILFYFINFILVHLTLDCQVLSK